VSLDPSRYAALKADIATRVQAGTFADPTTPDAAQAAADWYNLAASPAYYGIRTDAPVSAILDKILLAKYTPNAAITSGNAAQHMAATNLCMAKQGSLQLLGITRQSSANMTFDATKATQTATLKDATTALPTQGGSFATQDAGWDNNTTGPTDFVANQLVRPVTNAEKLFAAIGTVPTLNDGATARGGWNLATGKGNPDVMAHIGAVNYSEVQAARAS
jgi:hypothetical protein